MAPQAKTGMVLGKFMPLHRGHEALLRFARDRAEDLTVVVDNIPDAWVGAEQRCRWIAETVPEARVLHLPQPLPHPLPHVLICFVYVVFWKYFISLW
jgi:cytidyltransferase-like protein